MKNQMNMLKVLLAAFMLIYGSLVHADDDDDEYEREKSYNSSYYKSYNDKKRDEYRKERYEKYRYKKCDNKYRSHHKGSISRFFIGAVYSLDLTKDQIQKIDALIEKFQNQRSKRYQEFTKDNFDKDAFIKNRMQMRDQSIKANADLMDDIYSILTKEQRRNLKDELDDFNNIRRGR